jgi:hypothetical protein
LLPIARGWAFLLITRILWIFLNERNFSNRHKADVAAGFKPTAFEDENDDEDEYESLNAERQT